MANSASGEALLTRAMALLQAFDAAHPTLDAGELAARTGLPRTTTYRLLGQMVDVGLLSRGMRGTYRPGMALWEIANRTAQTGGLSAAALPFMEDVNQIVGHSVQLSILDRDEVLVLERLSRPGHAVNQAQRASRMPVERTSMGMTLLAFSDPRAQEEFIARHTRPAADRGSGARGGTGQGPAEPRDLRRELDHIRHQGYATFDGFIDHDTTGLAVPILRRSTPGTVPAMRTAVAALGVVVPRGFANMPAAVMSLRTAARGIARAL